MHVIPGIPADKWDDLCAELLDGNTAKISDIRGATTETSLRCKLMFEKWLTRRDATWDVLVNALENIQLTFLADTITEMLLKGTGFS